MSTNFKALTHFAKAARCAVEAETSFKVFWLDVAADCVFFGRRSVCR